MDLYTQALALQQKGKTAEAVETLQNLLTITPGHFAGWNALGQAMLSQKKYEDALAFFVESLRLQPKIPTAKLNIAHALRQQGRLELAKDYMEQVMTEHPNLELGWSLFSDICFDLGDINAMKNALTSLINITDSTDTRLRRDLSLPLCQASHETTLESLDESLRHWDCSSVAGIPTGVPNCIFQLAYYDGNHRHRLEAISLLFRKTYPDLNYISPNIHKKTGTKLKIGIATAFLDRFHAISFCYASLIKSLSAEYDLVYFRLPAQKDMPYIDSNLGLKKTLDLSHDIKRNRQIIDSQQVDILWYLDINMSPDTYFLAHSKLAPIQLVSAGHPCTTGISTIDYFISSQHLEPDNPQDFYTEKMIQLPTLPMIYQDCDIGIIESKRKAFDLPEDKNIYFCAQTLFKVHPKMDQIFKGILEQDSNALILFSYAGTPLATQLQERLRKNLGDLAERCLFIPPVVQHLFFYLLASVDVILDTTPFGSGNTLCQSLAVGTPTVCFDLKDLRGAGAPGIYRLMGIEDTTVSSVSQYIDCAIKIANTPEFRHNLQTRILENKHKIFGNQADVTQAYRTMFMDLTAKIKYT